MARVQKDPMAVAAKWGTNTTNSTEQVKAGIQAVTVAPGQLAAKAADLYVTNTAAAKGKFARNVAAVGLSDWQTAAIDKGLPRIASGVQAAGSKMQAFFADMLPAQAAIVAKLPPRGSLEANVQRSAAMIRGMAGYSYRKS